MDAPQKPATGTAEVCCAHDALAPVATLLPNPKNPNKHPPEQIRRLAKLIQAHGWRVPICVSKRSGMIVRGHARHRAAQIAGLATAPVDYQDYGSDEEEWADLLADNRISELSELDPFLTRDLLAELQDAATLDMEMTGYTLPEIEKMLAREVEPPTGPTLADGGPAEGEADDVERVIVVFADEGQVGEFFDRLGAEPEPDRMVYRWKQLAGGAA